MTARIISGLSFSEDGGVVITYLTPERDLLRNGLIWQHSVQVPPTDIFDEALKAVERTSLALLEAALDAGEGPSLTEPEPAGPGPYDEPGYQGAE